MTLRDVVDETFLFHIVDWLSWLGFRFFFYRFVLFHSLLKDGVFAGKLLSVAADLFSLEKHLLKLYFSSLFFVELDL